MEEVFKQIETSLRKRYYGWDGAKQFEGTGGRLLRMLDEFCWTSKQIKEELDKCFKAAYVDSYDELLVKGPITVWTLCPHHLLPCQFKVFIGYVPHEMVLGLSKFSRVADILSRRPVIQEMYSREVADLIMEKLKPQGVGVFVVGQHGCMRARGVRQEASVTTSVLIGVLRDKLEVRQEFLAIVRGGNHT